MVTLLSEVRPDEVYNLAAQSHVRVSFDEPEHTADTTGTGTIRMLEAVRLAGIETRFYQASSSELYGSTPPPQSEETPFHRARRMPPQALQLLDHQELPRGLRHVCGQRDSVQPRVSAAWGDIRDPQDHSGGGGDQGRPAGLLYMGNLDAVRDWGCGGVRGGDVADAAGR